MSLTQATSKLLKALERYAPVICQEKTILSAESFAEKVHACEDKIAEIEETLCINSSEQMARIECAFESIYHACTDKEQEDSLVLEQETVLLRAKNLNFILSKNIPRPQINFKDRDNKYTATEQDQIPTHSHKPLDSQTLYHVHTLLSRTEPPQHRETIYVDTPELMTTANQALLKERIVGVDVKTHKFRSYKGFICYIQVSTQTATYVFDLIETRNHAHLLTFLESEDQLKVFYKMPQKRHWIEKDLCCTIPLAIDILPLSDALIPGLSLTQMIKEYLGCPVQKHFHLLDWRHRPASREMIDQLKIDTEHLVPLATTLNSQLSFDALKACMPQQEYHPNTPTPKEFSKKYNVPMSDALSRVFLLRDFLAKQEDESPQFVLTDRQLAYLVSALPTTPKEVFAILPKVSPLFKANLNNFLKVLLPDGKSHVFSMDTLKDAK